MPIRVNLLVETKMAEASRRRDPVKWAIYAGAFFVVLLLVWSSSLQLEVSSSRKDLSRVQDEIQTHTNEYQDVLSNQKKINDAQKKLMSLQKLTASRFLQGNLLNALQRATLDGVQLARIRVDQSYFTVGGTASVTNDEGRVILGRAAATTEKIVLSLDARDVSANPEFNKFIDIIAAQSYFKAALNKTNGVELISLSSPQFGSDGKPYVLFSLECNFPEQTREQIR